MNKTIQRLTIACMFLFAAVTGSTAQNVENNETKDLNHAETVAIPETPGWYVILEDYGSQRLMVIKTVKDVLGIGLGNARDLVDSAPCVLAEGLSQEKAEELKTAIEEVGGTVTIGYVDENGQGNEKVKDLSFTCTKAYNDMEVMEENFEMTVLVLSMLGVFDVEMQGEDMAIVSNKATGKQLMQVIPDIGVFIYPNVSSADNIHYVLSDEERTMLGEEFSELETVDLKFDINEVYTITLTKTHNNLADLDIRQAVGLELLMMADALNMTMDEDDNVVFSSKETGKNLMKLNPGEYLDVYPDVTSADNIHFENTVGSNLIIDLKFNISDATGIDGVATDDIRHSDVPLYNLKGQRVSPTYRGIVVRRGHKYLVK